MRALDAAALAGWLHAFGALVTERAADLTELDRRIGDGDHGTNMARGAAAVAGLETDGAAQDYLASAARALISTVGGASGPLYGTFFLRLAQALPPDGPIDQDTWAGALRTAEQALADRGRASRGDKTMLDALGPALDAFEAADPQRAWADAAAGATSGAAATIDLVARRGRASYLGERSVGTADPGATSMALLFDAAATELA